MNAKRKWQCTDVVNIDDDDDHSGDDDIQGAIGMKLTPDVLEFRENDIANQFLRVGCSLSLS